LRDPEASDSFTLGQLETVHRVADSKIIKLQANGGWIEDPQFLGRLTRVLAYTGMHISVLSGGFRQHTTQSDEDIPESRVTLYDYSAPLDSSAVRGDFLYWRRPKNEKPIPMPIKRDIAPWLGQFLDQPRPKTTRRYQQILEEVEKGVGFPTNPLRFRHTCGVLLYWVLKMDAATVQRLLGCTAQTMLTYVIRTKEQIREEMIAKGW
jgi:integrase